METLDVKCQGVMLYLSSLQHPLRKGKSKTPRYTISPLILPSVSSSLHRPTKQRIQTNNANIFLFAYQADNLTTSRLQDNPVIQASTWCVRDVFKTFPFWFPLSNYQPMKFMIREMPMEGRGRHT